MTKTIIGVMGPGEGATQKEQEMAFELGRLIAERGWVLLTGGRNVGVMDAASSGTQEAGGLVIGLLPTETRKGASQHVDIPICTGIGGARNNINVLSSDVIVACGVGAGTTSEIMLALKAKKPVILLNSSDKLYQFIKSLPYPIPKLAESPEQAVACIQEFLS